MISRRFHRTVTKSKSRDMRPHGSPARLVSAWVAMFVLLASVIAARASAQSGTADFAGGHAWTVIEDPRRKDDKPETHLFVILHLPPSSPLARGAATGPIVRPADRLQKRPERLAWTGSHLYFVMPSETVIIENRRQLRRVYSMFAEQTVADTWAYLPLDGPGIEPSLPGDGDLIGFATIGATSNESTASTNSAATDLSKAPAALLNLGADVSDESQAVVTVRSSGSDHRAWRLVALAGREWVDIPLPWEVGQGATSSEAAAPSARDQVCLLSTPTGLGVFVHRHGTNVAQWWTCRPRLSFATNDAPPTIAPIWTSERLSLQRRSATPLSFDDVSQIEGRPIGLAYDGGTLVAHLLLSDGPVEIARRTGIGTQPTILTRGSSPGVLAVLWSSELSDSRRGTPTDSSPGSSTASRERRRSGFASLHLFEFFASGRVRYDGLLKQDGPLSIREVQLLAALFGVVLIAVMVFVLKPERAVPERLLKLLPPDALPAGIGRRLAATILDAMFGLLISTSALGIEWERLVAMTFTGSAHDWATLVGTTFLITWLVSALGEWQFGRSLGKWFAQCQVVSVRSAISDASGEAASSTADAAPRWRVELWQSLIRNALKWLPPLSLTVLLGPRTRHFADQVAGTMVVEPKPIEVDESP